MANRTTSDVTMTRPELASYLIGLADEFERGEDEIRVDVGNKSVTLRPPEEVECEIEVVERASKLRGSRETIELELSWKR